MSSSTFTVRESRRGMCTGVVGAGSAVSLHRHAPARGRGLGHSCRADRARRGLLTDEGLVRLAEQRAPAPFLLSVAHVPKPEDYVLARSEITLDDIYEAGEWSHIPTRLAGSEAPAHALILPPAEASSKAKAGATRRR